MTGKKSIGKTTTMYLELQIQLLSLARRKKRGSDYACKGTRCSGFLAWVGRFPVRCRVNGLVV